MYLRKLRKQIKIAKQLVMANDSMQIKETHLTPYFTLDSFVSHFL